MRWAEFRETRDHCKLAMLAHLQDINCSLILQGANLEFAEERFYHLINSAFDGFFPRLRVKLSSNDPVFVSPRVKLLLKSLIKKGMITEPYSLQIVIDNLIRQSQIDAIQNENSTHG